MIRQTKAELKSLVAELEAENKALRKQVEIQAEQISDLLGAVEWDRYRQKITDKAHDATIKKACSLSDAVQVQAQDVNTLSHTVTRQSKCRQTKQEKDIDKSTYCTNQFNQFVADGIPHSKARTKANKATAKQFGTGFEKSALYVHCPVPERR